jgi:ankyrin repeat protein
LNQAILRGNRHIIDMMLEHGNPNPLVRDKHGVSPVHVACSKLDWESLKTLVRLGGDPMLPDREGNTFLHTFSIGYVEDFEYDFCKNSCVEFEMRLTRNKKGKSPLSLIQSMDAEFGNIREMQPNYKKRLQQFFEKKLKDDPSFEDHESNNELHLAIIRNEQEEFDRILEDDGFKKFFLNKRNAEGQSPLSLTILHRREEMFNQIFDGYKNSIDFRSKDRNSGQTAIHLAVFKGFWVAIEKIYEHEPEICLLQDHYGRSSFQLALKEENFGNFQFFEKFKLDGMMQQDYLGNTVFHYLAVNSQSDPPDGDETNNCKVYKWLADGQTHQFFRARSIQNYQGQVMEHLVIKNHNESMMRIINPKWDI